MAAIARSPFLDMPSFERDEAEVPRVQPGPPAWSPFLSVYESADGENLADEPLREAYTTLVNDLYDEEFDEALFELMTTAKGLHQEHLSSGHSVAEADRIVTQHFSQLAQESETMVDAMARQFGSRQNEIVEREIDQFLESYTPSTSLDPEFQNFSWGFAKKIGKGLGALAKKAAKGIATLGLGPVLAQIKALVRPLLNRVLQKAIGRLPQPVQPAARALAARLGFAAPAPRPPAPATPAGIEVPGIATPLQQPSAAVASGDPGAPPEPAGAPVPAALPTATSAPAAPEPPPDAAGSPVQPAAGAEVGDLQHELDQLIAEALLSDNEVDMELEVAKIRAASSAAAAPVFTNLDDARERFIGELANLKEGENPAPYVENFLPAVLPALRIGIRLIGRNRVVGFLAGILGKLISNLIGPAHAPALSRAIVDAGLKLMSLEAADHEDRRIAASAVAATVEETMVRVASLPNHVLEDQELLEGFALEAFEQAAAANLPAVFPDAVYRKRPGLLEGGVNAAWIMLPVRRPRYKRCSRTFNVKITPHMAEAIESFEDAPLSEYLQDQLGFSEGEDVEAEIHLFEVLPGGDAADIARHETGTPGLGAADEVTLSQFQPLTHEAAGVLLGRPGLGRRLWTGANIRRLPPGQRVFHMVVGRQPLTVIGPTGRRRVRRLVRLDVTLDTARDEVRVRVFFSEVQAQRLAVRLRQQAHLGSMAVRLNALLGRRLPHILHGRRPQRLRIVHPAVAPPNGSSPSHDRLPAIVPQVFIVKMQEWLVSAFVEFAKTGAQKFLAASEDPADGVSLVFTIEHPPGLKEIAQRLAQKGPAGPELADAISKGARPQVRVEAFPGFKRD